MLARGVIFSLAQRILRGFSMNTTRIAIMRAFSVFCACLGPAAFPQTTIPVITASHIEGTNLVLTANIPAGLRSVTLEGSDRLGRLSWAPRAVAQLDASGGSITFRLPMSRAMEVIRIRASDTQPLPSAFFQGTNAFSSPSDSSQGVGATAGPADGNGPVAAGPAASRDV